nr:phosphatase PAP2 family protein [Leucobacter edaphi]
MVGIGSYVLGVQLGIGQAAEASVLDAAEFTYDPPPPLNLVSIPSVGIALLVIGLIALAAHGIRRAVVVTIVPVLAILASQALKLHLLTRPQLFELDALNTFPSGHMTVFTALTAALIWAVPSRIRALVAVAGIGIIGLAGWQLLAFGWHRPSDVFGAIALGTASFAFAAVLKPLTPRGSALGGRVVSIGLAMIGWIVTVGAVALAVFAGVTSNSELMLSAGEFGAIGTGALAGRSLLVLAAGSR